MQIEDIQRQLESHERAFPEAAIRAAMDQPEAVTPMLLAALQATADDPWTAAEVGPGRMLLYAIYLLAQFRERAAYPLLVRLFSTPGEVCFDIAGDVVTEDLDRILASVCGGDLDPIKGMLENPEVNEYVRSACIGVLVNLVAWGELEREPVLEYFRSLFNGRLERETDLLWGSLVAACCDLYPEELLPEIDRAFGEGLVDPFFIQRDSVELALSEGLAEALRRADRKGRIKDTCSELAWWACFRTDDRDQPRRLGIGASPVRRKAAKIGRNQPCPCGSGKKYKRCCGG